MKGLAALLLLVPTVGVQVATSVAADAVTVAGFEIDGNVPDDAGSGVDWGTPTGTYVADPTGNADTSNFGQGSKEFDNPSTWEQKTGVAPNQDDISGVYFHSDTVGDDVWGYVGVRRLTTTGVTNFDLEFNAKPNAGGSGFAPSRSVGDVMVRFEQNGNSTFSLTEGYFWRLQSSPAWDGDCIAVPGYAPAAGWCKEPSVTSIAFTGATGESGHFAEGAFNFSSLLDVGGIGNTTCEGGNFGTMNIRTFTGNADESALKDYVDYVTIDIADSCGELEITKKDQFGAIVPGATFSISPNPVPGQSASPLVVTDGGAGDPDGLANGVISFDPATPDTYTVVETAAPAGYELVQPASARTWTLVVTDDATTWQTGSPGSGPLQTGPFVVIDRRFFQPLTIDTTASGSYGVAYDWRVHKSVVGAAKKTIDEGGSTTFTYQVELEALPEGAPSNKEVHGTATVTNPNGAGSPAMRATLSLAGDLPCAFTGVTDVDPGTSGLQVDVAGGASPSYAFTCTPGAGTLVAGDVTATVTWDQSVYPQQAGGPDHASDTATYAITVQPRIDENASVTDTFGAGSPTPIGEASYAWADVWAAPDHRVVVATYESPDLSGTPGTCRTYTNVARVDESDTDDFDTDDATVELCVALDDLVVTKTAVPAFARDYDWTIEKSVDRHSQTIGEGEQASFEYDVVVTPVKGAESGFVVSGVITVDNPNETTIAGVSLSDTLPGGDCTISKPAGTVSIPAGKTTFDYTCTMPEATSETTGTNTATATWDKDAYVGTTGTASGAEAFDFATAEPTVTDGTATVTDTQVDLDGTGPDGVVVKAADGQQTFTYPKSFDGVPGECTTYDNTAKVVAADSGDSDDDTETVEVCVALDDLVVSKTAKPGFARDYDWTIEKSVDSGSQTVDEGTPASFEYDVVVTPSAPKDSGFVVTGTITVANPNQTAIQGVALADDLPGGDCTIKGYDGPVTVASGESSFDYTCFLPDATAETTGTNTATATWDATTYYGTSGSDSGTADFDMAEAEPVTTDATASVTDTQVDLNDEAPGPVVVRAEDGARTFTYTKEFDGVPGECTTYDNTAKVVAADSGAIDDDTETVEVCVALEDLEVTKTARPGFARDYDWTIEKSVDSGSQTVDEGTPASFEYDVVVTPSAPKDSGFVVVGTITVANPNQTAIAGVTLVDELPGGECTITGYDGPVTVESGESAFDYTCTLPDATAETTGTNTATASWDADAYYGTSGSDSGTADFDMAEAEPMTTDASATVTDTQVDLDGTGPDGVVVHAEDGATTFTYTKEFDGVPGECTTYDNTATVVATDSEDSGSDSETVEVCVEKPLAVQATGSADLARTYAWSIDKVADATQRTVDESGTATFTYTVRAKAGAVTESGWRLSGTVTVDNPNQWAGGTLRAAVTASTDLGGGSSCSVSGGDDVEIPADDSVTLAVDCTFASKPTAGGTLSVLARKLVGGEATGEAITRTVPITFGVRSETNKTVEVVDDKTVAGQRVVLDPSLTWAPGLVKSYTYSLAVAGGAAGSCQSWTNTATIDQPVGTDPTASAVVLACTPEVLPEQSFGKAVGKVKASCQGTVRAKLKNRSGEKVVYKLRVGKKVHRIGVRAQSSKKYVTSGRALAKVTLKVGRTRLDRIRIPARCQAPEVLPDTGLRATSR